MEMWVRGPFDYLHYYLSQGLLEKIALDSGVSTSFRLQEAFFIEDLVVAQMTKSILTPVEHGEPLDRLALDQMAMVLGAHTLQAHCGAPKFAAGPRRVMVAWQKLRTEQKSLSRIPQDPRTRFTTFCSCSEKSPAKHTTPSERMRRQRAREKCSANLHP